MGATGVPETGGGDTGVAGTAGTGLAEIGGRKTGVAEVSELVDRQPSRSRLRIPSPQNRMAVNHEADVSPLTPSDGERVPANAREGP
jgi:hypothetical protein